MMQNNISDSSLADDPSIKYGKFLAHPPKGEEVAISGISGQYPLVSNIEEFKNNLYDKIDMISHTPCDAHPEIPPGIGKLKEANLSRFDAGYFGVPKPEARTMSPICRSLLEKCVECIFDAGLQPADLEGTKTGVFIGICFTETGLHWFINEHVKDGNAISGNVNGMIANWISYFLKLNAPSFNVDTACSSTLYALDVAYRAIRQGHIEQALVCGANLVLSEGSTLQFARLGVLSKDGVLRALDEDGTGYVRAEAISAILLQKAKNCNRIYAKVLHVKTNCDGFKNEGITYPSGDVQLRLLKEMYLESGINPKDVSFIEAHATGTIVGDPEELNCVDEFFAKGRATPLLVGSVKSSIGHAEAAAGLCSVAKAILAFETNLISPNINFKTPRKTIPGLWQGRMKVVVENTPFQDQNGLIGVNSFGFGGGNAHALLKWNTKTKIGDGKPLDDLPRIVCASGRTEEAVTCLLADVAEKFDTEHIGLIHNSFRKPIGNHLFRGYIIVTKQGVLKASVKPFIPNHRNFHIYFGGLSRRSGSLAKGLMSLPSFYNFKNRVDTFLIKKQLNLHTVVSDSITSNLNAILAEIITQLCLTELLIQLEVEFQGVSAQSFGELICGFFENSLSIEDVLECAYVVGKVAGDIENIKHETNYNADAFVEHKSDILKEFKQILTSPKQNNSYDSTEVKTATPEYLVDAISRNAQKGCDRISKNSVILEIGQSLAASGKRPFLVKKFDGDGGLPNILEVLGTLYEYGINPQLQKLYPKVQFPVSRGTPMISSKIKWKHDCEYFVPIFGILKRGSDATKFSISLGDEQWADLGGHIIDGRNLFPATGYLFLAWFVMSEVLGIDLNRLKILFENCKFIRACTLPNKSSSAALSLSVMVQRGSGKFEVIEGDVPVVTGQIKVTDNLPKLNLSSQSADSIPNDDTLNKKDIYKELRLRGYNYKGLFRSLTQCNKPATLAKIQWANNWIAFMDNMLQLKILAEDTRQLYVPISIARLSIDPNHHLDEIEKLKSGDDSQMVELSVICNPNTGIIRSGGVEISGLIASSIPRRKCTALPVLEKYLFIPNDARLTLEQSVRVFMQVALENNCGFKVNVAELVDEASRSDVKLLGPIIQDVLGDQPLVTSDVTQLGGNILDLGVNVENTQLKADSKYTVVVGSGLVTRTEVLKDALNATADMGYIISREPLNTNLSTSISSNLVILNISETDQEKLVFLRKAPKSDSIKARKYINVSFTNRVFDWLNKLKEVVSKEYDVVAWCQNEPVSGIIGLVNCIRREPGCQNIRSLFIVDAAPDFDPSNIFYKRQLDKNMSVNVYMDAHWGTYRHLLLEIPQEVEIEHCYVNSTVRGDLSSIKWIEGPISQNTPLGHHESLVDVYFSSLNFRDVMAASGRINVDVYTRNRREQECVQGFEFSGKTKRGQRVMGMIPQGALATMLKADNELLWQVPDHWSLKDAATVPVVYGTCLYALVVIGRIRPSESILIHSGTGGIGQAAINMCLSMGCTVFTTVGTDDKRNFILKHFPKISEKHIGNSRDLSFEQMIMTQTQGKGVDIVLNSLAEEKLLASVRCLADNGRFLEIGKFDLANDNQLNLRSFRRGTSYHGVMLDRLFKESTCVKEGFKNLLQKYLDSGAVKPLMSNIFEKHEVEQAFRFMTAGKHMGKVLVRIRDEEESNADQKLTFKGLPRYYCNPEKTYLICGGLGGFGLELADWLALRGAKNLVLTSRKGITTGYQKYRISIWKGYGCNVKISTQDVTSKSGCIELIKEATDLAPVDGIFNLAVVLEDAALENQTETSFDSSFGPKAYATQNLDEVTREMCPELRDFVVFSSVSCGKGNAGQSNYGASNSVMERICEKRRKEGYPALAIQWGAIGDVGLVAEMQEEHMELEIGGTLQQSISNCLQVMDTLLRQGEAPIVSSMVVAEKRALSMSGKIEEVIASILGIRDIKSVSMHSTLPELGMDSMTGVEVKQILEREYNIFLSPSEMRGITLARIKELQEKSNGDDTDTSTKEYQDEFLDVIEVGLNNYVAFEGTNCVVSKLKSKCEDKTAKDLPKIIALPGIEGYCDILQTLTQNMNADAYGLNYSSSNQTDTMSEMADTLLPYVTDLLEPSMTFNLIGHSVGSIVALELVSKLEKLGYLGTLTLLDGSPSFIKKLVTYMLLRDGDLSSSGIESAIITASLRTKLDSIEFAGLLEDIPKCSSLPEKLKLYATKLHLDQKFSEETMLNLTTALVKRYNACLTYNSTFGKIKSKIVLFKPTVLSLDENSETQDYGLGQYSEQLVDVKVFEGTHISFLGNKNLADAVMENLII